ncbi:MAG: hypothetical protein AAF607_09565 [Pseudomonadota bacterium]
MRSDAFAPPIVNPSIYPTGSGITGNQGTGIPFDIPTTGTQFWAANSVGGASGMAQLDVNGINLERVDTVYMLINTFWGNATPGETSVEFKAGNGTTQLFALTGGIDIRDYNFVNNVYENETTASTTTPWFSASSGQALDVLTFTLGDDFLLFGLTDIKVIDTGGFQNHRAFVSGITAEISPIPLPGGAVLMLSAMSGIGLLARQRR